jgi:phosphate transport system permease protein
MTDWQSPAETAERVRRGLARRRRREFLFRLAGMLATAAGIVFLAAFFVSLVSQGASAFRQTFVQLEVELDPQFLIVDGEYDPARADFDALIRRSLGRLFPEVVSRDDRRALNRLLSIGAAFSVRELVEAEPGLVGTTKTILVPLAASFDMVVKGNIDPALPEAQRPVSDRQLEWLERLRQQGLLQSRFNTHLFLNGDSREPELAGILGAFIGSLYMMLVTALVSFPLGVAAAVYLEEFAPRNRWTDLIEVNINNLAAVPSIIFGLLGLAVFIDWMDLPRSAPLVGGLVLSLLTLPVIIISARAAIASVPSSIRHGALALGASKMQVVLDHVIPLALPGMLTGGIIGLSRALGETAPLLMIGMVAFIVDIPAGITDPSTALPVQIYLWADSPERAFAERTAAAILVLLAFLLLMNLFAVIMRRRLQRRIPG